MTVAVALRARARPSDGQGFPWSVPGWPVPGPGVLDRAFNPVTVTLSEGRQRLTRTCPKNTGELEVDPVFGVYVRLSAPKLFERIFAIDAKCGFASSGLWPTSCERRGFNAAAVAFF